MSSIQMTSATPYVTTCYNCQMKFDAGSAAWCSCIADESTLVCPNCLRCFCKAPSPFLLSFWDRAPHSLRQRRLDDFARADDWTNPSPAELARPAILLVDDDDDVLRIARRVIEVLGYGLVIARDGAEGLALARRYRPDMVLTDALMPRLDGRAMCLAIKTHPELVKTKVVVMSSVYKKAQYLREAVTEFKADAMLPKPIYVEELHRLLRDVMEG
jgi:CheY-like chemotaxis protein